MYNANVKDILSDRPVILCLPTILTRIYVPLNPAGADILSSYTKIKAMAVVIFGAPVVEELIYRFGIQDVLLKRFPEAILRKFSPGWEKILHSKSATFIRIAITAALFSRAHGGHVRFFQSRSMKLKFAWMFLSGIFYGMKKERGGLRSSIQSHMINNSLAVISHSIGLYFIRKQIESQNRSHQN